MKLIIQGDRIAALATDAYIGPETFIVAPVDFDEARMGEYRYVDGGIAIPPVSVPVEVTMQQARRALHRGGKLAAVGPIIDALPEPDRTEAQIQWEYSGTVQRYNGLVSALAPALGLTEADLDAIFTLAATL